MEAKGSSLRHVPALLMLAMACSRGAQQVTTAPAGAMGDAAGGSYPPIVLPIQVHTDAASMARARADSVQRPYTQADIDFMRGMISHHSQAIIMARWAPPRGASPAIQTLAGRIINAQTDEIITIQQWLADRGQPVPPPKPMPMHMVMDGMEHDMMMPGMLSDAQMAELDAARGPDFDRLFLTYMMQHHRGALTMVQQLWSAGGAHDADVFKFSNDVNVDQTTEIARMQRMLNGVAISSP